MSGGTVLAHVSDVHFGAHDPRLVARLQRHLTELEPDLIVVSGDLTQRARRAQFRAARAWLDALPAPALVIPGNHDVPLYDLPRRILCPLGRYHQTITAQRAPLRTGPGVRVLGLDSTRRKVTGRLTAERIAAIDRLEPGPATDLRVLAVHHPPNARQLAGFEAALAAAAAARVDVVLSGHTHLSGRRIVAAGPGAGRLLVNAATATSTRRRSEDPTNGFNVLRWDRRARLAVERWRAAEGQDFALDRTFAFERATSGWRAIPSGETPLSIDSSVN